MTKPITPDEAVELKATSVIPDVVFEVFNELIAQKCSNGYAKIKQSDAVNEIVERGIDRRELYDKGWLDVEDAYEAAGWMVEYDKPGYNETYPATFTFRKQPRRRKTD